MDSPFTDQNRLLTRTASSSTRDFFAYSSYESGPMGIFRMHSQTIRFRSASEMLETFGMSKGGKEYRRLIAAFERVFGDTILFGTVTLESISNVLHLARFDFFHAA